MPDSSDHTTEERQYTPVDDASLADDDDAQADRGRIGYGRDERKSSWLLGLALVAVIAIIGAASYVQGMGGDDGDDGSGIAKIGDPAPDFEMSTFDGETFRLSDHRGDVVIVNFWGSWCEPCREEMPAFQQVWEERHGDVMFVGVGSKRDSKEDAVAFAEEFGVTYPIGRDTEGGTVAAGQITKDYNIVAYPTTYVVDPQGNISAIIINGMDTDDLGAYIEEARNR